VINVSQNFLLSVTRWFSTNILQHSTLTAKREGKKMYLFKTINKQKSQFFSSFKHSNSLSLYIYDLNLSFNCKQTGITHVSGSIISVESLKRIKQLFLSKNWLMLNNVIKCFKFYQLIQQKVGRVDTRWRNGGTGDPGESAAKYITAEVMFFQCQHYKNEKVMMGEVKLGKRVY